MTARQLKAWVSILSVSIALAAFTGCARSPQARRDKHLAAGKKRMAAKDYSRAILEFRSAVGAMPDDAESYYQLGQAQTASRDFQRAYMSLSRAVQLNPKHAQAQFKLAELLAATRDPEMVKDGQQRLRALVEGGSRNAEVLNSLALTQLKLGQANDAIQSLQQALITSPQEFGSSILLAIAKFGQGDLNGAEAVLRQACASAPKSSDPHILLGEYLVARNRTAEAIGEFQRSLELDPKKWSALFDLAMLQDRLGRKKEAEEGFRRLAGSGEKIYGPIHAKFLFGEGRTAEAVHEFEQLAKADPSDRGARTLLIAAYQTMNRTADAEKILTQALRKNARDLDALLQRGELFESAGKYAEAERDLNEILHLQPDSAEVHYAMSKLHQARGEIQRQKQELAEALRLNPWLLTIRVEMAGLSISGQDPKAALALLDAAPSSQKQSLLVVAQRNWALFAMSDMAALRASIDQGLAAARTPDLLLQDGLWKLRSGNPQSAQAPLEEALKIDPADVRVLQALYETYAARKDAAHGLEKVKEYASRQPKSAAVQEMFGRLMLKSNQPDQARAAFNAAKAADPRFLRADFSLVQIDAVEHKWADARSRLQSVLAVDPRNARAHLWMAVIEDHEGHHEVAIEQLRKSLEADANDAQALNNLAYLLAEYGNKVDEALTYAQKACEQAPEQPDYADTLGWVFYRKGLYTMAVKQLQRATSLNQHSPIMKYHLAMAYAKGGDVKRGRETLEAALKLNPNLREAQMASAVLAGTR